MKNSFLSIVLMVTCFSAFCSTPDSVMIPGKPQKPENTKVYHVNYFVEGAIIGVGIVGDLFAIPRLKSKASLTDEELIFANTDQQKNLINTVDRWALKQPTSDRALWKKISDDGEIGIFLLPGLLMIDKNIRKDWLHLLFMYVEGHTVTFTFYNYSPLGPYFMNRYRPAVYYPELGPDAQKNSNNRNSFYSGHVASCAYSTFFMVKVYCDYHPNIGAAKYLLYLAASVSPFGNGVCTYKVSGSFSVRCCSRFWIGRHHRDCRSCLAQISLQQTSFSWSLNISRRSGFKPPVEVIE